MVSISIGVLVRCRFARARLTKLLHRLKQLPAVAVLRQTDATTLIELPFGALHKFCSSRHGVAKTCARLARFQAGAEEKVVRHRAPKSRVSFIAGNRLVDTSLIVIAAAELFALGDDLFCAGH